MQSEFIVDKILEFHYPRYNELPTIDLYKDQVINYIEKQFEVVDLDEEEKLLTPTMLNNYVKQKIITPPNDKKYNRDHLVYLMVICILKQVFTLKEIKKLIRIQFQTYEIDEAYDYFCDELEKSLYAVFKTRDFSDKSVIHVATNESEILRSGIMAFAHKIYVQNYLEIK